MRQLTSEERLEICGLLLSHTTYQAARIFNLRHANERTINQSTVARIRMKIIRTGNVERKKRSDFKCFRKPFWFTRRIRRYFNRHPHTTLRRAAQKFHLSTQTISKILKQSKFKAYKCRITQELFDGDEPKRLDFCKKMLQRAAHDPFFKQNILWSDECLFPVNGIFNRQNFR